ncbi:hypothetical protein [Saccharopolyspora phatthalungensis]|uniref:Uncharacterized protein n=1 Tax=Saccharopolyspora phatthalungensis TaxID=664693 RepID=A0A840QJR0_9PSEU|nr:hypothetical protein [Saccharopolyspora phatthalungensis]MBB5159568.1 hypothetical protein [Saccharopolyspora phatthalungensis]
MILNQCTMEELDDRSRRAEHHMNIALEERRWNLAQRHREEMLAVAAECDRRLKELDELAESTA